ncbi:MAG: flavodoxin-dependent (E)-4-hydroxy-3-methylbut-2-enyl-diphosphate synthase [Lentisphaeria bacterium]|nr:flavodoxin-dependent (E)-4-hydroxy-3-methylbut-2-enyl-diphosphate synthase [Lentisphaeria bacterium]
MNRRPCRKIMVGNVAVGGDAPVSVQSMLNVPTADLDAARKQLESLRAAGAQIVRLAVDGERDVAALRELVKATPLPLVADIQFDRPSAIGAIRAGVAAVRVNPGLFPADGAEFSALAAELCEHGTAIRVGANSGSIGEAAIREACRSGLDRDDAIARTLAEKTLRQCEALEKLGVRHIKAALKASNVAVTVAANRFFATRSDLPLHIGVTEAGTAYRGAIKSACGIGSLLLDGIGDTIRVSLTGAPEQEIRAGIAILEACGRRDPAPEVVSCPTCGRTVVDLERLVEQVESLIARLKAAGTPPPYRKIAVMGCPVNGPGEARDADLGLAGTRTGQLLLFRRGEVLGAFPAAQGFAELEKLLASPPQK